MACGVKFPDHCQMVRRRIDQAIKQRPEALDRPRRALLELTQRPGALSLEALSLKLGRNKGYLRDFVDKGSPRELRERDVRALAQLLEIPEEFFADVIAGGETTQLSAESPASRVSQELVARDRFKSQPLAGTAIGPAGDDEDLPILGHAKGGDDAYFIGNGEIAGYTMRPRILKGVADSYAVEFWDTSMEPVLKHGHLGWVHPRKPIKPGDDIVIQFHDGQALVKTLVRRTDTHLVVRQYNPLKEIKIERAKVKSIHLIVGTLRVVT
jgi:phage repressor protein C with HTH and peptisase S24 domain